MINYSIRLIIQRMLGLMCFLLGSHLIIGMRETIYFALYFITTIASIVIVAKANPNTLAQRGKTNTDSPLWDKILLGIYWFFAFFGIYYIAGRNISLINEAIDIKYILGLLIMGCSTVISIRALLANTFLESTARVQKDRCQYVVSTGIYSIVRHPTYSAILLWCVAMFLIFPVSKVLLCSCGLSAIIIARTYLEDSMLKKGLEGYEDYAQKVRYRLIPFIW